jgi:hypothetical protein
LIEQPGHDESRQSTMRPTAIILSLLVKVVDSVYALMDLSSTRTLEQIRTRGIIVDLIDDSQPT